MLRLNRFTYLAPRSVSEAIEMIMAHGEDAELMAGGTDVLVNIKHRLVTPNYVIGLRRIRELQETSVGAGGWLTIGAGVTLLQLERDQNLAARYPALAHSAYLISTPQVRAVGTIGGNLCLDKRCNYYNQSFEWRRGIGFCMKKDSPICRVAPGGDRCWAVASADTVPVLVSLRAEATVSGPGGSRRVPVEQLHVDDGLIPTTLQSGEIVTSIHLPPPEGWTCVYQKFRLRQSFDFPLVGVAAALKLGKNNTVEDARIVLTAVTAFPERAAAAEGLLQGRQLDASAIADAGQTIFKLAKPMDNTAGTIFHRKRMARVLTERALRELATPPARHVA